MNSPIYGGVLLTEDTVLVTLVIIVGVVAYHVGAWRERQNIPEYQASIVSRETCDAQIEEVSDNMLATISDDSLGRQVIRLRTLPSSDVPNGVLTFCSEISRFSDDENQFDFLRR